MSQAGLLPAPFCPCVLTLLLHVYDCCVWLLRLSDVACTALSWALTFRPSPLTSSRDRSGLPCPAPCLGLLGPLSPASIPTAVKAAWVPPVVYGSLQDGAVPGPQQPVNSPFHTLQILTVIFLYSQFFPCNFRLSYREQRYAFLSCSQHNSDFYSLFS